MNRKLVLEDGHVFLGDGFGSFDERVAEIVFNTSVVGYQEILSDPSYCGQMVCMTYPLIGNYGLTDEDYESKNIYMSGFIVREYNDIPSNFRFTRTLGEVMEENHAVGISGVDTREIVRLIRDKGSMKALICDIDKPIDECMKLINNYEYPKNQVPTVSSKKIWYSRTPNPLFTVVAVDCGVKLNIIRKLNQCGCNVVVVPYDTPKDVIMKFKPDGLFLSNGPGDPENVKPVIELVRQMKGVVPILGICLGHQIIGLAYGATTYKMKFGQVIKNGLMLAIARLPMTIGVRLATLIPTGIAFVVALLVPNGFLYAMMGLAGYYLILGNSMTRFVDASFTNAVFDKYINSRIEGVEINRGLAKEEDDDYTDEDEPEDDHPAAQQ